MKMTGKTKSKWAEVEVRIYNSYCKNKELVRTVIGWVKVIDDSGVPNIFSVPTPCG